MMEQIERIDDIVFTGPARMMDGRWEGMDANEMLSIRALQLSQTGFTASDIATMLEMSLEEVRKILAHSQQSSNDSIRNAMIANGQRHHVNEVGISFPSMSFSCEESMVVQTTMDELEKGDSTPIAFSEIGSIAEILTPPKRIQDSSSKLSRVIRSIFSSIRLFLDVVVL
ncbi:hypothetical protein J8273_2986 [Carpediemonas membranifera]|uniref:Uncharacterized protein n=1 Tax=Carpediemonas membranifera TaxID=201153 RepID=A0A8J6B6Q3_9EUKA|nr:hypothetical protein J8273_2986 [Carpediemonas membranifera]|eukprot:KAG9395419.1 hypothetical protein J8273_2986 [Carpediemonas membranifera]